MVVKSSSRLCHHEQPILDLYEPCVNVTIIGAIARFGSGIMAVSVLPITVLGTMSNLLLAGLLAVKIRRAYNFEAWGLAMCLIDTVYLWVHGLVHLFGKYGVAWWGLSRRELYTKSHLHCKVFAFFRKWSQASRPWIIVMAILAANVKSSRQMTVNALFIVLSLTIITVYSLVYFCLYEISIRAGVWACLYGPGWHRQLQEFTVWHELLFKDGLVALYSLAGLAYLTWYIWLQKWRLFNYSVHGRSPAQLPLLASLAKIQSHLADEYKGRSILACYFTAVFACRSVKLFLSPRLRPTVPTSPRYDYSERVAWLAEHISQDAVSVFELATASANLVWWSVNDNEVGSFVVSIWSLLVCKFTAMPKWSFQLGGKKDRDKKEKTMKQKTGSAPAGPDTPVTRMELGEELLDMGGRRRILSNLRKTYRYVRKSAASG